MKPARKALENLGVIFHAEHLEFTKETFAACRIITIEERYWQLELNEREYVKDDEGKETLIYDSSPEWEKMGTPPSLSQKPAPTRNKPAAKTDFLAGPHKTYRRGAVAKAG